MAELEAQQKATPVLAAAKAWLKGAGAADSQVHPLSREPCYAADCCCLDCSAAAAAAVRDQDAGRTSAISTGSSTSCVTTRISRVG